MMQVLTRLMILSFAGFASVAAHAQPLQDHPHGWHGGGDWSYMMFGPLMMLVFVAVVVVVVVLAVRWLGGAGHGAAVASHPHPEKTPIFVLEERFASGEIDRDEFEERRRILSK
jgi:putative membrane protein